MTLTPSEQRGGPPSLEIDLGAVVANWRAFAGLGPAEAGAAVKADAYGCGAARIAPALETAGCRTFFVATLVEATRLAPHLGADSVLYVLNGPRFEGGWPEDPRLRPVLSTLEEARAWSAAGGRRPAALQIETGMNRLGLSSAETGALLADPTAPDIALVLSHLAAADEPENPLVAEQKRRFDRALPVLRAIFPQARASLAATGGALLGRDFAYDLIRPGVGLYGGLPFADAAPVLRLSAPLMRVWTVAAGQRSGYGGDWRAARPSRLATLPLGYADGIPRALGGVGRARIHGAEVPVAGRISMDLTVLDVTDLDPAPQIGDRAALIDEVLTIDRVAAAAGTIGYELLTRIDAARRLDRRAV